LRLALSKTRKPYLKNNQGKKGWGMVQVSECLPNKLEDLNSNPVPPKEKKIFFSNGRRM
jgi:hypothetical protein